MVAKKTKTSLGASLTKNTEKVDLKKNKKNLDNLENQVSSLHSKDDTTSIEDSKIIDEKAKLKQIQFFLDESVHRKIKLYCVNNGLNLKDFISSTIIEKAEEKGIL